MFRELSSTPRPRRARVRATATVNRRGAVGERLWPREVTCRGQLTEALPINEPSGRRALRPDLFCKFW